MKRNREDVIKAIFNSIDSEKTAREYLLGAEPAWMHNHLARCTRLLIDEAFGRIEDEDKISPKLFL